MYFNVVAYKEPVPKGRCSVYPRYCKISYLRRRLQLISIRASSIRLVRANVAMSLVQADALLLLGLYFNKRNIKVLQPVYCIHKKTTKLNQKQTNSVVWCSLQHDDIR